jgi:hypothetical protein
MFPFPCGIGTGSADTLLKIRNGPSRRKLQSFMIDQMSVGKKRREITYIPA